LKHFRRAWSFGPSPLLGGEEFESPVYSCCPLRITEILLCAVHESVASRALVGTR
jgi:hypothetical protein